MGEDESDAPANIGGPIAHLTFRRVAASNRKHLLENSTTSADKRPCFYRQNVSQKQVDNFRRFQTLAEEYVTLSDQITQMEFQDSGSKKNSSPKNSPTSSSRKLKPS